ncbi:MAG: hypothetical protein WDZ29_01230 [Balneolaceae bacterium]
MDKSKKDRSLDDQFRERLAEGGPTDHYEEAWKRLVPHLDSAGMQRKLRRVVSLAAAIVLLALSVLGYYTWQNHQSLHNLQLLVDDYEVLVPSDSTPETDNNIISEQEDTGAWTDPGRTEPRQIASAEEETATVSDTDTRLEQQGIHITDQERRLQEVARIELQIDGFTSARDNFAQPVQPVTIAKVDLDSHEPEPSISNREDDIASAAIAGRNGDTILGRITTGLVIGPGYSTVNSFQDFTRPGLRVGVTADYTWTRSLAVSAGLLVSDTRYRSTSGNYEPKYGYSGADPDLIRATCLILEIPLSIQTNLYTGEQFRLFAGTGINSLIMAREKYRFTYPAGSSSYSNPESITVRSGNGHWFSSFTIHLGYEQLLSDSWSIRSTPYVSIPLQGVGWGDVNLYSAGLNISFHFRGKP